VRLSDLRKGDERARVGCDSSHAVIEAFSCSHSSRGHIDGWYPELRRVTDEAQPWHSQQLAGLAALDSAAPIHLEHDHLAGGKFDVRVRLMEQGSEAFVEINRDAAHVKLHVTYKVWREDELWMMARIS
jgi:hypothetical protein